MFRLATFDSGNGPRIGITRDEDFYPSLTFKDMRDVLDRWDLAMEKFASAQERMALRQPEASAKLLSPLPNPRNIYIAGANYTDHLQEMLRLFPNSGVTKAGAGSPWFTLKSTSTVVGPGACVQLPGGVQQLDWEVELAIVIGKPARAVSTGEALKHVAGYMVANDLSARDRMIRHQEHESSVFRLDWIGHKSFDGACPMGPTITPAFAVEDVQSLDIQLWVNDELMQHSNTRNMVCSVAELITHLSHKVTLLPGDVILSGTPAGVGAGRGRFLKAGDRVRQKIEHIGEFEFTIGA